MTVANALRKFAKYIIVAATSAGVDWIVFTVIVVLAGNPIPAQASSRIAGAIASFSLNKYWSFESRSHRMALGESGRFLVLFSVSYALALSLFIMLTRSDLGPYWSKLIADSICFLFNFAVMSLWVYRPRPQVPSVPTSSSKSAPEERPYENRS